MKAIELFLNDGKPAGVFYCEKCHRVALSKILAEECCQNYTCRECGADTGARQWIICEACRTKRLVAEEAERFQKASKVYYEDYDGWVYHCGIGYISGCYSPSVDEFTETCEGTGRDFPEYAWACKARQFAIADISDIVDRIVDDSYEDFDPDMLSGVEELKKAISAFNEANKGLVAYEPDYTKAILFKP